IPAFSGRRVWEGHWGETPEFDLKYGDAAKFFLADTPSSKRRELLARTGITHVFAGEAENSAARDTLAREPFLHEIHRVQDTVLYEVVPRGRQQRAAVNDRPVSWPGP